MRNNMFVLWWNKIQEKCHNIAYEHGFWDEERNKGELIALMHSELSEALEALRKDDRENLEEELADCIIRIMDFAGGFSLNVAQAILNKIEVNKTRPHMHGKKF